MGRLLYDGESVTDPRIVKMKYLCLCTLLNRNFGYSSYVMFMIKCIVRSRFVLSKSGAGQECPGGTKGCHCPHACRAQRVRWELPSHQTRGRMYGRGEASDVEARRGRDEYADPLYFTDSRSVEPLTVKQTIA